MKEVKTKVSANDENSRSVVEAAIDLSRSKEGTWEDIVSKSSHKKPYTETVCDHSPIVPQKTDLHTA